MKNSTKALLISAAMPFLFTSCDKMGEDKNQLQSTEGGLQYQLLKDEKGPLVKVGDFITMHFSFATEKDSIINSTFKSGQPLTTKMFPPTMKGGLEEGLLLMSAGDSALFLVPVDSLLKGQPASARPAFFPPGSKVKYRVKMLKVTDSANVRSEQLKSLENFRKSKNLNFQSTASGLWYSLSAEGSGPKANPGDTIEVHYAGTLLESGKEFDNSKKSGKPFRFPVGMGRVISGWDEGMQLLPAGSKATLLIPSWLAYGEQGIPNSPIGPNAALVFEVEILKITPMKAAANAPAMKDAKGKIVPGKK